MEQYLVAAGSPLVGEFTRTAERKIRSGGLLSARRRTRAAANFCGRS